MTSLYCLFFLFDCAVFSVCDIKIIREDTNVWNDYWLNGSSLTDSPHQHFDLWDYQKVSESQTIRETDTQMFSTIISIIKLIFL